MGRIIRILALASGLFCAFIGAQAPEFAQQYRQRMGGRIDELNRIVKQFDTEARKNKKTPEEALQFLLSANDSLVRSRGEAAREDRLRLTALTDQHNMMKTAGAFQRIIYTFRGMDTVTAEAALQDFEFAIPVNREGIIIAGVGFIFGYGFIWFLSHIMHRLTGIFFRKKKPAHGASNNVRTTSRSFGGNPNPTDSQTNTVKTNFFFSRRR